MSSVSELKKLEEIDLLLSRIPPRFWRCSLSQVDPAMKAFVGRGSRVAHDLVDTIRWYGRTIEDNLHGEDGPAGLYLIGPNGVGKTALACMIAMEARRRRVRSFFIRSEEIMDAYINQTTFTADPQGGPVVIWKSAMESSVLVIDDLGKGMNHNGLFATDVFLQLLRTRVDNDLITIITSNMELDALEKKYGKSAVSLIEATTMHVEISGPSRRPVEGASLESRFRALVKAAKTVDGAK